MSDKALPGMANMDQSAKAAVIVIGRPTRELFIKNMVEGAIHGILLRLNDLPGDEPITIHIQLGEPPKDGS